MNSLPLDQVLQLFAWFLALAEFVAALYILLLNTRHTINRHMSAMALLLAANSFVLGAFANAPDAPNALLPSLVMAATTPMGSAALLVTAIALLKPEWLRGRWRWAWRLLYVLILWPLALTLVDYGLGTEFWYTGINPQTYAGGWLSYVEYTGGLSGPYMKAINFYIVPLFAFFPLLYVAAFDKQATKFTRRMAWILLAVQITTIITEIGLRTLHIHSIVITLTTNLLYVLTYSWVAIAQMRARHVYQRGRLQVRLTLLIAGVAIPVLAGMVVFVSTRASAEIRQRTEQQLEATNRALAANVSIWLKLNAEGLQQLTTMPDIINMDAQLQKPLLVTMAEAHPHMSLVSTTDMTGTNIARSDALPPQNYRGELWHLGARNGAALTLDVTVDPTLGQPTLVMAMPIRRATGTINGVAMFASDLASVTEEVQASQVGETGSAIIVDAANQVVAHSDPAFSNEMRDFDKYPPVFALRSGERGIITYTDEQGQRWRAYVDTLEEYNWGVIIQQEVAETAVAVNRFQNIALIIAIGGVLLMLTLTSLIIRQVIRPVVTLTNTATAIADGDLERRAVIESEDEFSTLAEAFNRMTSRLRELIATLDQRVNERTEALALRSRQLQAAADVSQVAASILDIEQLFNQVVDLIQERFNLYYVGLFLTDDRDEWAVLQAGTGAAGEMMLKRRHRIRVGEGMIGWSIANAQARVAQTAAADAVRLATAELPETRAEAAIPMRARGQVIGALTVQDSQPGTFDENTLATLQSMADQVGIAILNARLFAESEEALARVRRAYGERSKAAWQQLLRQRAQPGYRTDSQGTTQAATEWPEEAVEAWQAAKIVRPKPAAGPQEQYPLAIPLTVRDEVIGVMRTHKSLAQGPWSDEEVTTLQEIVTQLSIALDSARLYEETQLQAERERIIGEVAAQMGSTLDVESVVQTAVNEIYESLDLESIAIRFVETTPEEEPA